MLVIRGRRWSSHKNYFTSNKVLEALLWHWVKEERPFDVYKEGNLEIGGGDPVLLCLDRGYCDCEGFCWCNLVGIEASGSSRNINGQRWRHPGGLCTNSTVILHSYSQSIQMQLPILPD